MELVQAAMIIAGVVSAKKHGTLDGDERSGQCAHPASRMGGADDHYFAK